MNPSDPLAQLRDIHLPEAISWWPLAFGWWIIAVICILGIVLAVRFSLNHFFSQRYRRQALAQLKKLPNSNQHQRLIDLLSLLKQVSISAYPEKNFASLSHQAFIEFLQNSTNKTLFSELPANWEPLLYAKQQPVSSELVDPLFIQANQWIKHHLTADKLEYKSLC